jgi:hypothetical protein
VRYVLEDLDETDEDEDEDEDEDGDGDGDGDNIEGGGGGGGSSGGGGGGCGNSVSAKSFPSIRRASAVPRGAAMRTFGLYLKQRHGLLEANLEAPGRDDSAYSDTGRLMPSRAAARC